METVISKKSSTIGKDRIVTNWNGIAFLVFLALGACNLTALTFGAHMKVIRLDRAGVINHEIIAQKFPYLKCTRLELGRWIAEKETKTISLSIAICIVITFINFLMGKVSRILNIVTLVIFLMLGLYLSIPALGAVSKITTLDKAGVINHDVIDNKFPEFKNDIQNDLGCWLVEKEKKSAFLSIAVGIIITLVNFRLSYKASKTTGSIFSNVPDNHNL